MSAVREVVVLGRRGPAEAACTAPELLGLASGSHVDIAVDAPVPLAAIASSKEQILAGYAQRNRRPDHRRITFALNAVPVELAGQRQVWGARVLRRGESIEVIECGLVLRSIGSRGAPIAGLPFDTVAGTVANDAGRVIDPETGRQLRGRYVTGWIKRGPTGVVGTNRLCAHETVEAVISDFRNGLLDDPVQSSEALRRLVNLKNPRVGGVLAERPHLARRLHISPDNSMREWVSSRPRRRRHHEPSRCARASVRVFARSDVALGPDDHVMGEFMSCSAGG